MAPTFLDNVFLWIIVLGPIAAWVFLFWLTSESGQAASDRKKEKAREHRRNKSLERIATSLEKNSSK
ncbi:MAG: hypothetical protein ABSC92_17985 [Rhizomicrobium sp.]|jgi:hypothetical protein